MVMSAANNGLRKITLIPDDFSPEDQLVLKSLEPFIEEAAELLRRYTKEEQFIIDVFCRDVDEEDVESNHVVGNEKSNSIRS